MIWSELRSDTEGSVASRPTGLTAITAGPRIYFQRFKAVG